MDLLDLVLIVVSVLYAISGYRRGLLVGVASLVGFIGGGVVGATYAPSLHSALGRSGNGTFFGLVVVVLSAGIGQLALTTVAAAIRGRISWQPARVVDAAGGAVANVASLLVVVWFLGTAIAHTSVTGLSGQVRNSSVLAAVDNAMPASARTWFSSYRQLLDRDGLAEVFASLGSGRIVDVAPPKASVVHKAAVRRAESSIVKIRGAAPSCSREVEGSGFVISADHVMTNAHVIAGVTSPGVLLPSGQRLSATVVLDDPDRDIAVLDVPGLDRRALTMSGALSRGDNAVVAGYPEDGPFTAVAARVRTVEKARGTNIYQSREVTREIYSLYATVRPGNSGGPLLTTTGRVAGVVFAASVDSSTTGYALTAAEVAPDLAAGVDATRQVSSGACD
jgi:S1-C subfamily serine protease